ncbi:MAG: hypothetical protein KBF92_00405 [Bacteroidia bacterium]|nr:hypothetical protein [Bacteroidia bacterium]MBP9922260.1 hypothetical protein [Bacteroidia bacterium]HQV99161.1 hypothetical protein [Bacteroidia bacterium]
MSIFKKLLSIILLLFTMSACNLVNKDSANDNLHFTFTEHIAPIIYKNCSPCHRPGSGAPFDLITFEDVKEHLKTVQLTINERLMPPWPADTAYSHFRDEKVITKEEIYAVNKWIEEGAVEGDNSKLPSPPVFYSGSLLGKPDLTLKMKPYKISGDNKDNFIMLKIPFELEKDTFIRAIEIIPGNKKLVHHINAHLIQYSAGAKKNYSSGKPFVDTEKSDKLHAFEALELKNDDGTYPLLTPSVTNYLPGVETAMYPQGIGGFKAKKNGAILLDNIHYGPSPIDTSDETEFNIFFAPKAPARPTTEFILGTSGISPVVPTLIIPPNEVKTFVTRFKVDSDISLLTVNPHMHLLGKKFVAYGITPGNDTLHLIRINNWDFRWQYFYTFEKMVKIPAGTEIVVEGTFDNTVNNPLNPFNPPRTVSEREGSMRTTDEMFQLICTFLPYQSGDENISLKAK